MSEGAYFVGRAELLAWINSTLDLNYAKIEQTANGGVACQIIDALHPGNIAFSKVKFNAATEYEMISNYKVLQTAFNKLSIDKSIDVTKLIKAKPLDNIEFMQWLKSYFDRVTASQGVPNYDAAGRRSATKGGATGLRTGGPAGAMRANSSRAGAKPARPASASNRTTSSPTLPSRTGAAAGGGGGAAERALQARVAKLEEEVSVAQQKDADTAQERDFYFSKLREIELLCQHDGVKQRWDIMQTVENILYAATEEEGTQARESMIQNIPVENGASQY